ncbi:MAG: lytic murein transglycosylase [Methylomonas sp.]|nr:MAG: lytic murein transglycosylase [Methylobacter sp.]PPD35420.1 MAG: lytic murein transglycosylase [Methylomonas sp.]
MTSKFTISGHLVFLLALCAGLPTLQAADLAVQRQLFLQAEQQLADGIGNIDPALENSLKDYPLFPYLQYQQLKGHLEQTDEILDFLSKYPKHRYSALLRSKWLHYLAGQARWADFLASYQPSDDKAIECLFYRAELNSDITPVALSGAKALWISGEEMPPECDSLFEALVNSQTLSEHELWQRFKSALNKNNVAIAESTRGYLPKTLAEQAGIWLKIHKKPALVSTVLSDELFDTLPEAFVHGIERLAKTDLYQAIFLWDTHKQHIKPEADTVAQLEAKLGTALAFKKDKTAYSRFGKPDSQESLSDEAREWRLRAALLEQNWSHVLEAYQGLTENQKSQPEWTYWQARALDATGDKIQALSVYQKVAGDRSLYGFLAADKIEQPYWLGNQPVPLAAGQIEDFAQNPDIQAVKEWRWLDREAEARRQWWFSLGNREKEDYKVAAKLAQQWQWHQVAIFTLAKANYWDDLALRFPLYYTDKIQFQADKRELEPAIVFGLIRQESIFDSHAESAAGAKGLMQIMPGTGKHIAHQLKEKWHSQASLYDPDTNIRYGTYYFRELLDRFNGHFALATAAYNAGPGRVKEWLKDSSALPADIWVATIPFKETRKYVSSVLTYAVIYQHLTHGHTLRVKNLMFDILPY